MESGGRETASTLAETSSVPVVIAGGGPVSLSAAALLAHLGVPCLVLEADASWCDGSRAICLSRRSQEILGWVGADRPLTAKGLPWIGGRSYFRDTEVLHFEMPNEPAERFAPMINIQQYYVEQYVHAAALRAGGVDMRWSTCVSAVRADASGVDVQYRTADGRSGCGHADWLVACDGGRSTVREQLGLQMEGMQYEGRYVIVDIEQNTRREVERLAWFARLPIRAQLF